MDKKSLNTNLGKAGKAKKDEFYTQLTDTVHRGVNCITNSKTRNWTLINWKQKSKC